VQERVLPWILRATSIVILMMTLYGMVAVHGRSDTVVQTARGIMGAGGCFLLSFSGVRSNKAFVAIGVATLGACVVAISLLLLIQS
jgi:hypothetical protein